MLTVAEWRTLEGWASRRSTAQGSYQRAHIVLMRADGMANRSVGAGLGITRGTAGRWRNRFVALNIAAGKVMGKVSARHATEDFKKFLDVPSRRVGSDRIDVEYVEELGLDAFADQDDPWAGGPVAVPLRIRRSDRAARISSAVGRRDWLLPDWRPRMLHRLPRAWRTWRSIGQKTRRARQITAIRVAMRRLFHRSGPLTSQPSTHSAPRCKIGVCTAVQNEHGSAADGIG
ncbi:helix-turn-helix domain-containing protein [Streptomyces sp. NPDC050509]|uniref:helix-turn-helix domain-containing protein n=1 Tax=Streptomyces sp. NPDC050509 TaxID=3365620 RepID=UPI00379B1DFF